MKCRTLNGIWKFHHDPRGDLSVSAIREDFHWNKSVVPQNWRFCGGPETGGICWYRRTFRLDREDRERRVFIRFDGVDYACTVWVNGIMACSHEGYFQAFEADITSQAVYDGMNTVTVRVESPAEAAPEAWPAAKQAVKGAFSCDGSRPGGKHPVSGQQGNTGGIWNDVSLLVTGDLRLLALDVRPLLLDSGDAQVVIRARIANYSGYRRQVRLAGSLKGCTFSGNDVIEMERECTADSAETVLESVLTVRSPRLWWTWDQGRSDLYQLTMVLHTSRGIADTHSIRFGIRSVREDARGALLLNGRRIFMRGTCCMPSQWLSGYGPEEIDRDLTLVKEANLNAVRLWSHINRPGFYEACDREGILVWQDFPLAGGYEHSDRFREEAVRQARDMVVLLGNYCSIAVWCCHNEPGAQADTLDRLLARAVREADASRPVRSHLPVSAHPFTGWAEGGIADFDALPGAPLPAAFGAQALPEIPALRRIFSPEPPFPIDRSAWEFRGFQYDKAFRVWGITPEESPERIVEISRRYQARLIKRAIETYRQARFEPVNGFFQYLFADSWPAVTFAVLDWERNPKPGYTALQTVCQPVLVSFKLEGQDKGEYPVLRDLVVINDLPEGYSHTNLRIDLAGLSGNHIRTLTRELDVPADTVTPAGLGHKIGGWAKDAGEPVNISVRLVGEEGALLSENAETVLLTGSG